MIGRFVDRTTMYRLVLYYLLVLFVAALVYAAFGALSFSAGDLFFTAAILCIYAWVSNELFAWLYGATTNAESALITGLILAFILPPIAATHTLSVVDYAVIAAWAMASKYVFAWGKKHIFNPAALAVVLSAYLLSVAPTWWVAGNVALLPFVFFGGLLIVWKLRRFDLVLAFFAAAAVLTALTVTNAFTELQATVLHSAIFFLGFVMLTEPLTMPPTRTLRLIYGVIVAVLFVPTTHVGSFYFTPELALLVGNVFSYFVSPKGKFALTFVERHKLAHGIYEFVFTSERPLQFRPGQYIEWTLGGVKFDSRGNRRYFTLASAPEENVVRLGVRFYAASSEFKRALAKLQGGETIYVGSLAGDFTLPKNKEKKLAFIAGGIGVTPFASMARHLHFTGESRDAVLLYSSKTARDVAYQDVFAHAKKNGLRTAYAITDETPPPGMHDGTIDADFIRQEVPDYKNRLFYLSGPKPMVDAMQSLLHGLGVSRFSIKTDYFPGLA